MVLDEIAGKDLDMSNVIAILISFQLLALVILMGQFLRYYSARRRNRVRRSLINRLTNFSQDPDSTSLQSDTSVRAGIRRSLLSTRYGQWLERQCIRAGRWQQDAISSFVGRKLELSVAGLLLGTLSYQLLNSPMQLIPILMAAGFAAPDLALVQAGERRADDIARALPETIDLLNMTVGAGLGFQSGLDRISRTEGNPLSDEFRRVLAEIRLGDNRSRAFTSMAERINRPEIWSFTNAISQVEKLGIPITNVLKDQARTIRAERREKARERAQKLPVKILAPIMLLLFPMVIIIVIAPAVLSMLRIF